MKRMMIFIFASFAISACVNPIEEVKVYGINITESYMNLKVGEYDKLEYCLYPEEAANKNVKWSIDDDSVALIDADGTITAKNEGSAEVKIITEDGGFYDTCNISVYYTTEEDTGIDLNIDHKILNIGQDLTLSATFRSDKIKNQNIIWSSDNDSVATVDQNGLVRSIGNGTAIITAAAECNGYIDTCVVFTGRPFIFKWNAQADYEKYLQINTPYICPIYVTWGDGAEEFIEKGKETAARHEYQESGTYEVRISGSIEGWHSPGSSFEEITQWGDFGFPKGQSHFSGCKNLSITAADIPAFEPGTDLTSLFKGCEALNDIPNIDKWDVSGVVSMSSMFENAILFNGDISKWDTSSVADMNRMFYQAASFNRNISNWRVSDCADMSYMFYSASIFDQDISAWDVSKCENMNYMFAKASIFNQGLSTWTTSAVKTMEGMFLEAYEFDGDLSGWDVSAVTDMSKMFRLAKKFDCDLSNWKTGKVAEMDEMFCGAHLFDGDISTWDTSNVTTLKKTFWEAKIFNQDLNDWNTLKVTDMNSLFRDTNLFNGNIADWKTSNVTDMFMMFYKAKAFDRDISGWDVGNVRVFSSMFAYAAQFNQDLPNWNTESAIEMGWMFFAATRFSGDISGWNTSNVTVMEYMFYCNEYFNSDISKWKTSSVTNMSWMFGSAALFNCDISGWDTSNVIYFSNMFNHAAKFDHDLSEWKISSGKSFSDMFSRAGLSTINYDALLISWAAQDVEQDIDFNGGSSQYSSGSAEQARQKLTAEYGWTITDAGLVD